VGLFYNAREPTRGRQQALCLLNCLSKNINLFVLNTEVESQLILTIITGSETEWWGIGMIICLERGADLHMAQLMPLPLLLQ